MRKILSNSKVQKLIRQFGVECLWYQSKLSPELRHGLTMADADAIHGYKYDDPVQVRLIRTSVSYHIITRPAGKIYEGGARFSIPPVEWVEGEFKRLTIYDRIFKGDIIVIKNKPIRDFDVLTRGKKDVIFAFDVKSILSLVSVNAEKFELRYIYGTDYKIKVNGTEPTTVILSDGTVQISASADMPVVSDIEVEWLETEDSKAPAVGADYAVEFLCSPNYIVWEELAKARATEENDLPKMVMTVKRAFFNKLTNPIDTVDTKQDVFETNDRFLDNDL